MNHPTISVVIPVYNGEALIHLAVESVYKQTTLPSEVIVVNDGSTDGTGHALEDLSKGYPITVVTTANGGEASARNTGVDRASSDFVAFLDHDDVWHVDKLERQLDQLVDDPTLGMSFTGVNRVGAATEETMLQDDWDPRPGAALQRLLAGVCIATPSAVVARRVFLANTRFDTQIQPYGCDWLMWLTLAARGAGVGHIPKALVECRRHDDNLSLQASYAQTAHRVIERFLDQHPEVQNGRFWRAHWHLFAAERGEGRSHLLKAAQIRPMSIRPGWLRIAIKGSA